MNKTLAKLLSQATKLTAAAFSHIFPIKRSELKKFCAIAALLFCILFVQNISKALKDSLITTLVATEVISVLKIWGVLPSSILAGIIYVKLTKTIKAENIFYTIITAFVAFFLLFAFVILPKHIYSSHLLDLNTAAVKWKSLKLFALVISNWSCSLLYVVSELWSNIVLSLLFWQFVNAITPVATSKRLYVMFGVLGQTGLYLSGSFLQNIPNLTSWLIHKFSLKISQTVLCIQVVLSIMALFGIASIVIFFLLNKFVIDKEDLINFNFKPKKSQQSTLESIKLITQSKYIRLIGLLLMSYGISITTVESMWKDKVRMMYQIPEFNLAFTGMTLKYSGIVTIVAVIVGSGVIRKFGWKAGALITPICTWFFGTIFFITANCETAATVLASIWATNTLYVTLIAGALQNIFTKATKYTLFDATKEMSYVPLDPELKTQGKACADTVGVKFGKSLGALIQASIFSLMPNATFSSISVFLMILFSMTCVLWCYAANQLGNEYNKAVLHHD
ncbi:Npt1/Npt2 family nucleotide transporter [Candidatus Sneabacter namystus]|uniref:ADP,ATP carrier protein n=1 Tax=Candidatus Sneabacter namystus TaxID=2601646 RepID=A0A5C0ULS8_9RICK|nr:Npt1/Npt2 family nucleotide transporter [Candidatus Sneabacter namystus]QEK39844.1 ADP/ATP carrier protein [Candidatus Sneabacter namystus]